MTFPESQRQPLTLPPGEMNPSLLSRRDLVEGIPFDRELPKDTLDVRRAGRFGQPYAFLPRCLHASVANNWDKEKRSSAGSRGAFGAMDDSGDGRIRATPRAKAMGGANSPSDVDERVCWANSPGDSSQRR